MSMTGKTLGHYSVSAQIGKGGMGEVYQAKDQKLGRDVAIKVLPEEFAKDADRVARFQREAKLLASLNHSNIASIYGLEESDGIHFLVLELIEGDTLADRLKRGAIPVEESLKLALQIAEALEAAHEKGVIHRDLKPANIKVTPDGKVKVLDFGLAKAFAGEQAEVNLSHSPTLSEAATLQGVILGTAAYMSPEQARGKEIDKRVDVWAFGVVLFEMLTGRSLFSGEDVSSTLARVLEREPDFSTLPPRLHPRIRLMLERCLKKEPKNRYSSISDARVDIQEVLANPSGVLVQPETAVEPQRKLQTILPWVAAAIVVGGIAVWLLRPSPPPEPKQVIRLEHELPESQHFNMFGNNSVIAVSPDGTHFVYSTPEGLYMRSVDELEAKLIPETNDNPISPFLSPDGQWIGYCSLRDFQLKKVAISGGAPVVLCDATGFVASTWYPDNTIVYAELYGERNIKRVSADDGTPEQLAQAERLPYAPQILPDGKTLMYTIDRPNPDENGKIILQSLETDKQEELLEGEVARYLPSGHLVYALNDDLFTVPFNLDTLKIEGVPVRRVKDVMRYEISNSGTLVYIPGRSTSDISSLDPFPQPTLVWVDREGNEEPLGADPNNYRISLDISPDGKRVALDIEKDGNEDIWVWDIAREIMSQITRDNTRDITPLWTPDSQRIVYQSVDGEEASLKWKKADGSGEAETLCSLSQGYIAPFSWSNDGNELLFREATLDPYQLDIGMLSLQGDYEKKMLLKQEYSETKPQISPDGKWLAYQSNETGRDQIYVRPFPDVDKSRERVSQSGGNSPLWSPDGQELFYRNGDTTMVVIVDTEPTFNLGKPEVLFQGAYVSRILGGIRQGINFPRGDTQGGTEQQPIRETIWDIHPDGRFLLVKRPQRMFPKVDESRAEESTESVPNKIIVVINWFEELKERVPLD